MKDTYAQLFLEIRDAEPSDKIFFAVVARIENARIRRNRIQAGVHGALTAGAAVALVPAAENLLHGATQSGFLQYASLVSDGASVLGNWKEVAWSLGESMPVFAAAVMLAVLIVLVNSL